MKVVLKNPRTGESKEIKVGWSWTLFFFSSLFGIPLFMRRLYMWGAIMFTIQCGWWACQTKDDPFSGVGGVIFLAFFGLPICLAAKGNELTAKNYLADGWVFALPNSFEAIEAMRRWDIQEPTTPVQHYGATASNMCWSEIRHGRYMFYGHYQELSQIACRALQDCGLQIEEKIAGVTTISAKTETGVQIEMRFYPRVSQVRVEMSSTDKALVSHVANRIQEIIAPTVGSQNSTNAKLVKCPYCAEDIQAAAIKCKHCGSDLSQEQAV